ncbi:cyclodextrin transporter permease [Alicyclobacillus cellulosilyticus]|uniref:Cyclodextrin transporter permease n=1 Tax=Alicyclobacillus cellulosilyticus TaxID=1003997 RepID=A0A917K974_9BACL|nr:sugar ABC transporter permease [Alicyclobacillus cellulosilyticus]GGJ03717.1 cyclodextrin transporter permease [Alicyclobacillus cellulosilyticus]
MSRARRAYKPGERLRVWSIRLVLWVVIVMALLPLVYVVTASFSPTQTFFSPSVIPQHPTLDNYRAVFQSGFMRWVWNSTEVAVVVSAAQLVMTSTAAYAFSRLRFIGRKYGLMTLLLLQMFPNSMAIAAIYAVLARLGILDRLWVYALLLIGGSAFNIWLMKGYFDTIPRELDESAYVDGAGHFQIFWRIVLPLARPMLAVVFFLTIIGMYSEYILAGTVLQSPDNYTLGLGMFTLISGQFAQNWGIFAAGSLMAAVPLSVAFAILNPMMARGLTAGATKG